LLSGLLNRASEGSGGARGEGKGEGEGEGGRWEQGRGMRWDGMRGGNERDRTDETITDDENTKTTVAEDEDEGPCLTVTLTFLRYIIAADVYLYDMIRVGVGFCTFIDSACDAIEFITVGHV
jgi:hypothetical protein